MSNLVNVVKALLGSKFDVRSFEAKNRVFKFDHQFLMFGKMVFDPSPKIRSLNDFQ